MSRPRYVSVLPPPVANQTISTMSHSLGPSVRLGKTERMEPIWNGRQPCSYDGTDLDIASFMSWNARLRTSFSPRIATPSAICSTSAR